VNGNIGIEIAEILSGEGPRVEWKESPSDSSDVLHAVCALANDLSDSRKPGFLVFGVNKQGVVVGADASDETQRLVANWLASTKIWPHASCEMGKVACEGHDLLVVRVMPYEVPPVVKVNGVAWVRVGTTTRRATDADLARLQERRPENRLPFDLRAVTTATLPDDLDINLLRATYNAASDADRDTGTFPSFEEWLGQRELVRRTGGRWVPTPTGLLLFGIDPQSSFPGAVVEFARYAGNGFDAPVTTRRTATGRLQDQLEIVWTQLQAQVAEIPAGANGIRTVYRPEYPLEALKELARNLVQHRLYEGTNAPARISWLDGSVVFSNPGGPFGQASQGAFGEHADYRNPTITRHLVELGYVERLGRGVRRVRALLQKNGNPDLEVETDNFTTVTVRRGT
jgi:ATP-dependent DNA helicase RecG